MYKPNQLIRFISIFLLVAIGCSTKQPAQTESSVDLDQQRQLTRQRGQQEVTELENGNQQPVQQPSKPANQTTPQPRISKKTAVAPMPDWARVRPIDSAYYIGIGRADRTLPNYAQQAKNRALAEVASEIAVSVASELVSTAVEKSGMLTQEVEEEIRSTTQVELEGVDTMGTWDDNQYYWIYCRLNKLDYANRQAEKVVNAAGLALDLYQTATGNTESEQLTSLLSLYLQALLPIQNYLTQPLTVSLNDGSEIQLQNRIYTELQAAVGQMSVQSKQAEIPVKFGQAVSVELRVQTSVGASTPLVQLPVSFTFVKGSGDMIPMVTTNETGMAISRLSKVTTMEKIQIIVAKPDLVALVGSDQITSNYLRRLIENLPIPTARFILQVSGPSIYIEAQESNLGQTLSPAYIVPELKKLLSSVGFTFTDNLTKADFMIQLQAESRSGSEVFGQYTAYVDLTVSVTEMKTGQEIHQQGASDIKGIHLDYQKAGLKAFETARDRMTIEIAPGLLTAIQK